MTQNPEPNTDTTLNTAITEYLEARAKPGNTGNYHATAKTVLKHYQQWCHHHNITDLTEINTQTMRNYAKHLRKRTRKNEIKASTAHTYYNITRGCLAWNVKDNKIDTNPAADHDATDELPSDTSNPDETQQFWTENEIKQITHIVNTQAYNAIEKKGTNAIIPVRNRALVYTITYSGVRGAEIFSSPTDTRDGRNGITWERVHLDDGTLHVRGKNQEWEHAQLPDQCQHAINQHYRVQSPSTPKWPVFPTAHTPTIYNKARETLTERGYHNTEIENIINTSESPFTLLREHDISPPPLTTEGARNIMKRLCEHADLEINGDYLKPHGARRGLGNILYRENAELAQSALRHESIETTHDAYSDIVASETSDSVTNILENHLSNTHD